MHSQQAVEDKMRAEPDQDAQRVDLPLSLGPRLFFKTEFCSVHVVRVAPDVAPYVELHGKLSRLAALSVDARDDGVHVGMRLREQRLHGWGFWGWGPPMTVTMAVPSDVDLTLQSDVGRVRVSGLSGCRLNVATEAGALDLDDVHGALKLHTSAGTIRAGRLGGTLDVSTHAGSIRLAVDALDDGDHRVHSDVGSIRVELAETVVTRIEANTTLGAVKVDHPHTNDAPALLAVSAEMGSVRVRTLGARHHGGRGQAHRHAHARHHGRQHGWQGWHQGWGAPPERSTGGAVSSVAVPSDPPDAATAHQETLRVLKMLESGTITAEQAEELLRALGQ